MSVSRLLRLLEEEPTLAAILKEMERESAEAVGRYSVHERRLMDEVRALWDAESPLLLARSGEEGFEPEGLSAYRFSLVPASYLDFPPDEEPRWDRAAVRHRISKLKYWVSLAFGRAQTDAERGRLGNLELRLTSLKERHEHAFRAYRIEGSTLPGPALARLRFAVHCLNPSPLQASKTDEREAALVHPPRELAELLHEPTQKRLLTRAPGSEIIDQARRDATLLQEELLLSLGLARSRITLVHRFVVRAERFHSDRLRALATSARRLEKELVRELSLHLFEAGLDAVADPSLLGARPDAFAGSSKAAVHVEARLLPRAFGEEAVVAAVASASKRWTSAASVHGARACALLLVRVGGPILELPEALHARDRELVLAQLDLGKGGERKGRVLPVDEAALRQALAGAAAG